MLWEVQIVSGCRFITQDEALAILAEGPYESQLYEVIGFCRTRYHLDITRNDKLVARIGAKRPVDVMDAVFLAPELRFRLIGSMITINPPWGFK